MRMKRRRKKMDEVDCAKEERLMKVEVRDGMRIGAGQGWMAPMAQIGQKSHGESKAKKREKWPED